MYRNGIVTKGIVKTNAATFFLKSDVLRPIIALKVITGFNIAFFSIFFFKFLSKKIPFNGCSILNQPYITH